MAGGTDFPTQGQDLVSGIAKLRSRRHRFAFPETGKQESAVEAPLVVVSFDFLENEVNWVLAVSRVRD